MEKVIIATNGRYEFSAMYNRINGMWMVLRNGSGRVRFFNTFEDVKAAIKCFGDK